MYARHLGWLNATPEKGDKPRRYLYTEGDPYLELPPLSEYEQSIVQHWMKIGTVKQTSAGIISLDWGEIIDWAKHFYKEIHVEWLEHPRQSEGVQPVYTPMAIERCSLLDWELEQIKHLSQEYTSEYSAASDPSRICPKPMFLEDVSEDAALQNAKAFASSFRSLFGADNVPKVEAVPNT